MKKFAAVVFSSSLLLLTACEVKETKEGSYQVETPTASETAAATSEAAAEANEAAADAKEGARDAAHETGTAMETAGQEVQEHAKPGDQK